MSEQWILILVLCIVTFLSRLIGVEMMAGRILHPTLRLYFNYVPIAMMVALIVDQIITTDQGSTSISLPIIAGAIATTLMIKVTRSFLPTVIIGVLVGLGIRYLLSS
ncbi:AzlD domain-containing protein [Paenibacillus sp. KACC 21273]|uniref:AzlD domain-containing protein n=1 Tax=Paenibacillus sp. KACC 21273 TaxID=3025665 RepID=UPI00236708FE|nr:AzlD domain-containing protein [Paenibacillus sp. KACC 21273]WDF50730.1 AzlD domain-containing protein [Paenibacillus sp. KACC 21273]